MVRSLRTIFSFVALAAVLAVMATPTGATIGWCKRDPIVDIGGKRAHVYVSSLDSILVSATGPTDVVITVPNGVATDLIGTDDGFGYGYNVRFEESGGLKTTNRGIQIEVEVEVPATDELPVLLEVTDGQNVVLAHKRGETNEEVLVRTTL